MSVRKPEAEDVDDQSTAAIYVKVSMDGAPYLMRTRDTRIIGRSWRTCSNASHYYEENNYLFLSSSVSKGSM